MDNLNSLPDEVLLDNLLPYLDVPSLLAVSQTNRHLAQVSGDNTFWRRKCKIDYNLPGSVSGRIDGWKELYGALRRPSVYVWGASSNGRLGIPRNHPALQQFHAQFDGINLPVRIPLDDAVGVVDLQASGYGFVALDTTGKVWVWGTLDGSAFATRSNPNWMHAGATAEVPRELLLDARIESIDCGRRHVLLLDETGTIWELTAWGKAIKYDQSDRLTSIPRDPIIQISAGWSHSSSLTASGKMSIWWADLNGIPLSQLPPAVPAPIPASIPVSVTTSALDPFIFDPLPSGEKVIKIASGANFLVALTEEGKAWTAWVGGKVEDIGEMQRGSSRKIWEEHPSFSLPPQPSSSCGPVNKITHISAHFETFFSYAPGSAADDYATSVVFKGCEQDLRNEDADATGAQPEIIPELQGQGVIKVAVGDYHFGALTAKGKLLTWGGYSSGALGLGQTPNISVPSEVRFDANGDGFDASSSKKFCFGVAASGWHTGALLVDLTKPTSSLILTSGSSSPPFTSSFIVSPSSSDPPSSGRPIPGVSNVPMLAQNGTPTSQLQQQFSSLGGIQSPYIVQPPFMGTGGAGGSGGVPLRGNWRGRIGLAGAGMFGRGSSHGGGGAAGGGRGRGGARELQE